MYRKAASIALIVAIALMSVGSSQASAAQEYVNQEERAEKWKQEIIERAAGEKSRWEVKFQDGRKIKGYTSEIREEAFTLINWKTHDQNDVSFDEITSLERKSSLPVTAQIAIAAGFVVGILFAVNALLALGHD